tara:strand:- start:1843 stop:2619 length:777 start_codon:yes stop_codon:yes gene_type:complete
MSKVAVVFSCAHADPSTSNERFDWLGELIYDVNPNYIVDLGDGADMRSLNSFDGKNPEALVSQSYERDIDHYNEAMDRLRRIPSTRKYKRPSWFGFEGNHEHRIKRAISSDSRISSVGGKYGLSFSHLQTDHWFDEYHEYENSGPAIAEYDGVSYAHFFQAGNFGSAVSGLHHANTLLGHRYKSSTCGHSHKRDLKFKDGAKAIGLVAGCYKGAEEGWAGQSNRDWWKGVVIKREIDNGIYEPEFVSLKRLKEVYGKT